MPKKNNDYFELLKNQASYCVKASCLLEEIFCKYTPESINAYREQMHTVEHAADNVQHDILNRLSTEFITPIDQEDILRLVQIIDDITDALDQVVLDLYMYHTENIPEHTALLSKTVNACVKALYAAIEELKSFKKPYRLRELLVVVNDIEFEADEIYQNAIHALFATETDIKTLLGSKEAYEGLENCCDLCEHAADVIAQIIIKNT